MQLLLSSDLVVDNSRNYFIVSVMVAVLKGRYVKSLLIKLGMTS
jgi:hypothetical protein